MCRYVTIVGETMKKLTYWWKDLREFYPDRLAGFGLLALIAIAVGGFYAAAVFLNNNNKSTGVEYIKQTINHRVITTKLVPVVRTIAGKRVVKYRIQRVVEYKPIYKREVVTLHGKSVTVKKLVGRKAVTVSKTITNNRTVTNSRTSTVVQNQTQTQLQTVTGPGQTVIDSVTETVTQMQTQTETVPITIVDTQTDTVTVPITVTITLPGTTN